MKTIKKLGVMSFAKMLSLIIGGFNLIIVLLINIIVIMANLTGTDVSEIIKMSGIQIGLLGLVKHVFSGLITGFIMGIICVYLYNVVAQKIGGIQIELK